MRDSSSALALCPSVGTDGLGQDDHLPTRIRAMADARLDLIDEYRVTLVPYLAGEGTRLFEDVGKCRSLDLLSSTAFTSGLQLEYRRHR
jgi:riboflavin biosynthesis pyrimidine reductase